ncbi:DUF58 domain-containing protein [Caulobacter henricii]|uniref:DUF58 domain-containing protein n=1 Tax=Caulobacter henricii TaxID=69395 RepID=A0A0P0P060_9CAUL|nr:DUF58 domain-containing protein [Caulobacter henricii]ALL13615.1 hypothetical protein AQ619_09770 [Caulobacter henricii]
MSPFDLPPDLRSRLRRLSLAPRSAAALVSDGMHASRNRGGSMEFAQYRGYERGDDLRRIDWKLYSRSDRFFVRDAERESPVAIWIVLDASASMGQTDLASPNWSRFDAAKRLMAAIMDIALRQGDRFGTIVVQADSPLVVPPSQDRRHQDRLRLALGPLRPGGIPAWQHQLATLGGHIAQGDVAIIVTDGFDDGCITAAEQLSAAGRDVSLIQVLTADERDFPFDGSHRFRDPELETEIAADGRHLRAAYLTRFAQARADLRARLEGRGIRFAEHFTDQDPDGPIQALSLATGRP